MHYFPPLTAFISRFGGVDGKIDDAKALNDRILRQDDEKPWTLPYVHAAFRAWWLTEYSGWYGENHDSGLPENQIEEGMFTLIFKLEANSDMVLQKTDSALNNLRRL